MAVLTGKKAPGFRAQAVFGKDIKEIQLADYQGKYVILFFYPLDFTFVCPTELHAFQSRLSQFKERGVEVLGCSVDSHFSHWAWLQTPKGKGGIEGVTYGLVSDLGGKISRDYDVLNDEGVAYRGLFLIDRNGVVRHQLVNDLPLGRSVDEAIRMVDALQHFEKNGEVCPADWHKGEQAMKATHESVGAYLSKK
ncbi:MAG TPA: peroxiredoxin [Bdellovibrionota bacterium]|jgi:peroxiredoxin (alkyl hydroperoxide reductase subunit C)|nr:peroxiredoxin [Bdellovibrionota bacterium]